MTQKEKDRVVKVVRGPDAATREAGTLKPKLELTNPPKVRR